MKAISFFLLTLYIISVMFRLVYSGVFEINAKPSRIAFSRNFGSSVQFDHALHLFYNIKLEYQRYTSIVVLVFRNWISAIPGVKARISYDE